MALSTFLLQSSDEAKHAKVIVVLLICIGWHYSSAFAVQRMRQVAIRCVLVCFSFMIAKHTLNRKALLGICFSSMGLRRFDQTLVGLLSTFP